MSTVFDPLLMGTMSLDVVAGGLLAPDAIAARQHARLTRLLDVASRGSRIYRERLRGVTPEIGEQRLNSSHQ